MRRLIVPASTSASGFATADNSRDFSPSIAYTDSLKRVTKLSSRQVPARPK